MAQHRKQLTEKPKPWKQPQNSARWLGQNHPEVYGLVEIRKGQRKETYGKSTNATLGKANP